MSIAFLYDGESLDPYGYDSYEEYYDIIDWIKTAESELSKSESN
jgi:hypothetical protein